MKGDEEENIKEIEMKRTSSKRLRKGNGEEEDKKENKDNAWERQTRKDKVEENEKLQL